MKGAMKSAAWVHQTTCRVIYGDTDKMGYAYHANYFRWFEIGRTEMLRCLGLSYKEIENRGVFLPVSEAHCRFFSPVQYDDLLVIETDLDRRVKGGIKFDYRIHRDEDHQPVAEGYTKHPCVNGDGKVIRPPKFLRDVFSK